ncbi:hypothetical protein OJ253_3139 [Cryptosporidium canis]|uniref:Ribosomal RNA-processing protein 14/surfeit locus protein 6 C-terminal domain-containing protein n=1 Tax=Cryptosporidium canis TaxID=195482 RepID=A0A9D5HUT0_9CRYT|nr:hypothetical protein OJ253_3139 [Cryptosporidium canis]
MTVTRNIWRELGSFSAFLGYIPYNILLASENGKDGSQGFAHDRREKFGLKSLLPTFAHIRDFFNVNKNGAANQSGPFTPKLNSEASDSKLTRNDLERKLARKIQELKQNNSSKKNKQSPKKVIKASNKQAGTGVHSKAKETEQYESSLEFGRIIDSSLTTPGTASYLQKRESKMKKIKDALNTIKKEEEFIKSLPEEEKKIKIKEIAMGKAMQKAQGIKVKDNKHKLIKTKKSILAKKKKSRQKWAEISKNQKK